MKKEGNGKIFWGSNKMQISAEVGMRIATRTGRADDNVERQSLPGI
jgi:hypothetical protein